MIEVFKTDVKYRDQANVLVGNIERCFKDHRANFDLGDCDKILRVENRKGQVESSGVIALLKDFGFNAGILPDIVPVDNDKTLLDTGLVSN